MDTRFDHSKSEKKIYDQWEKSGFFNPDVCIAKGITTPDAESFCIIMPPPNANGHLHAGHAMFVTVEDIMTRYARMRGKRTLWLPGADHAGFETQVVYEKKLEKEGRSRFQMTREELYGEIMAFTLQNKKYMEDELRSLGASCDWSRESFTLDENVIQKVYHTFKKLSDDGLIYRGKRIVSWCSKHQTSFSNLEVEDVERNDSFYYLQYGPFVIGTARPETKFGDKYVVMHPEDKRYTNYKNGEKIHLEWINGPITATIIKDSAVDMEFGTGVMTITPWHDATDFDIAERHDLDKEQIIDERGKLLPIAEEFAGMKIEEARPKIIEKLQAKGLLVRTDKNYMHVIRTCYKCNTIIEPQIKDQWFVKMKPLAESTIQAIESNAITFVPEHYKKICLHWLRNIIDWNISRQIAWGIPIPAKICDKCGAGAVDIENKITSCPKCSGTVHLDPDTFDTWFSSGQWPPITLGHPDGKDFKTYYPTSVMETAGEIIFFWVTRMIMLGLYITGDIPFRTVYLHGLVLDGKGQKMSKSKGNVINPLDITSKYGTDALRMALVVGNTPGTPLALSEDRVRGYRNFATKIWNVSRFILMNESQKDKDIEKMQTTPSSTDTEYLAEAHRVKDEVGTHIETFEFHLAAEKAYQYFWHTFADKVVESAKLRINSTNESDRAAAQETLLAILKISLKMLHPFVPFVTEEVWGLLPLKEKEGMLMVEKW